MGHAPERAACRSCVNPPYPLTGWLLDWLFLGEALEIQKQTSPFFLKTQNSQKALRLDFLSGGCFGLIWRLKESNPDCFSARVRRSSRTIRGAQVLVRNVLGILTGEDICCLASIPIFPTKRIQIFLWGIHPVPMLRHVV